MTDTVTGDVLSRLLWAFRRYAAVLIAASILCVGAASAFAPPPPPETYEASALVAARELSGIRPEHLPRMAQAIFTGNNVARTAVELGSLPLSPGQLITDHAELEVIAGTVVSRVNGRSTNPQQARDIANSMAQALVLELNRLGPGVGSFAVQEDAALPTEPVPPGMTIPPAAIGLAAGLVIGGGIVVLILLLRKPVLEADDAVRIADAQLMGILPFPSGRLAGNTSETDGIVSMTDRLFPDRRESVAFLGRTGSRARSHVATLATMVLSSSSPLVCFVRNTDRAGVRAASVVHSQPSVLVVDNIQSLHKRFQVPIVFDGHSGSALADREHETKRLLVVEQGIALHQLRRIARRAQLDGVTGVVWVEAEGGLVRRLARRLALGLRHRATVAQPYRRLVDDIGGLAAQGVPDDDGSDPVTITARGS